MRTPIAQVACLLLSILVLQAQADDLMLVDDGRAACTIAVPDKADSFTRMAASWLADYVEQSTGATLNIVEESAALDGTIISVGHTRMAAVAGVTTDDLTYDACRLRVAGDSLYLVGRDSPTREGAVPEPEEGPWRYFGECGSLRPPLQAGPKGTCRAVTRFLQSRCGVQWLVPTPMGTQVPKTKTLVVPRTLDDTNEAAFGFYVGTFFYGSQLKRPAPYANSIRSGIQGRHYGGHSYLHWFNADFNKHPEYFVKFNGERTRVGLHVCPSNPEVRKILLRELQAEFDAGHDWVEMGQSDGHVPCECDDCEAMEPDPDRRMLQLHKWICDEAAKSHPEKTVLMLAYGPTRSPHPDIQFGNNVVIELTGGRPSQVEKWQGYGRGMMIYHYWLDESLGIGFAPRLSPANVSEIIRYYHDQGVIGIYGAGGGFAWGLMGPTYYTLGQLLRDPKLDYKQLTQTYCGGLYGAAAEEMENFFELLYRRTYWKIKFQHSLSLTMAESLKQLYPPSVIHGLEERLRRAEHAATTEREKQWVQLTRDEFDYLKHMSGMLYLYDAYKINKNLAIFAELKTTVDRFQTWRRRVVMLEGDRITNYFPGHGYFAKYLSTGANSGYYYHGWMKLRDETDFNRLDQSGVGYQGSSAISQPITLDFDAIGGGREFRLRRAPVAPVLDGKHSTDEWDGPVTIFRKQAATQVRGMYDDANLYITYTCEEPHIDKIIVHDLYRDGDVSEFDCVEFMVSSESSVYATRYYHFLVAPAKDAVLDLRTGFKSGRDQDEAWNANGFAFGYHIDKVNKQWTVELRIPLQDINAPIPKPGDVWMGNLARERRVEGTELQLWSQGGRGGFTDPNAFGRFVFE
jgi:hypothetical protein